MENTVIYRQPHFYHKNWAHGQFHVKMSKPSFLPKACFPQDAPPHLQGRIIPERSKSQSVSVEYLIPKEISSQPLEVEELPKITDFISPDEVMLLNEAKRNNFDDRMIAIAANLEKSEKNTEIIANKLDEFANELNSNIQYLENIPEFQPRYMGIQEKKTAINVSNEFYQIPSSKIFDEIPKIFS